MTILSASKTLDTTDRMAVYRITDPNACGNMKELSDKDEVDCFNWIRVEDVSGATGELVEKVFIETGFGLFATISKSFIKQFSAFVEGNGESDELSKFRVIQKETKNGRTCILFSPLAVKEV